LAALADAETAGDGEWPHAGREEKVALAGFALYDFWCAVAELVIEPFLPQVSGFHHVGIGRNHAHIHWKSLLNSEGSPFWRRSSIELYRIAKGWMARPEIRLGVTDLDSDCGPPPRRRRLSAMKALVIGGTGPTGHLIVNGLIRRGYEVTILHTGRHELKEIPTAVEHIHSDPFSAEALVEALGTRTFDLTIAAYGRLRTIAEVMAGRTAQ